MQVTRHVSEVAAIREQIAAEYLAAKLGLEGLNVGTSRHAFITARMEHMGVLHKQLQSIIGDKAIPLIVETIEALPDIPTRSDILAVFRRKISPEEVEPFCNALQEVWKVVDLLNAPADLESCAAFPGAGLLKDRFGDETACKLIFAPPSQEIPVQYS